MRKTRNRSQSESKYLSVKCPRCRTIWRCYGMREQNFYKCSKCGHGFKLSEAKPDDLKSGSVKDEKRQPARLVTRLDNATRI